MILADEASKAEEILNQDTSTVTSDQENQKEIGESFLCIKEVRAISRAKALRLKIGDVIVAIAGKPFNGTIDELLDIFDEIEEEKGEILTIWREGISFNLIIFGPLGCIFEFTQNKVTQSVHTALPDIVMGNVEEYVTFELLRNIRSECDVFDTRVSQLGIFLPPVWLIQQKLWEPLVATIAIYAVTLSVHWILFIISAILLALYFRNAQLVLLRSFSLHKEKEIWMIIAAKSMVEVQKIARAFDNKLTFRPDLVGPPPPVETEKPKKKKKKKRKSAVPRN